MNSVVADDDLIWYGAFSEGERESAWEREREAER